MLYAPQIGHQQQKGGHPGPSQQSSNGRNPAANVFRNATGILRNISAINDQVNYKFNIIYFELF